jgi:hypothetical protein
MLAMAGLQVVIDLHITEQHMDTDLSDRFLLVSKIAHIPGT